MLIMLVAALTLIVLLRRFDRMRSRLTDELHVQAMHDPLTGLANRRQLTTDLTRAIRSASRDLPARLVVFDLDGFKSYNDAFGHHGGDLLLTRLARALAAAARTPTARPIVSAATSSARSSPRARTIRSCDDASLRSASIGDGFAIAKLARQRAAPDEAHDPDLAMQLADERMYAEKNSGRASAGQQTRNLALKVLSVQQPDVEHHSEHVAALVARVGRAARDVGRRVAQRSSAPPSCTTSARSRSPTPSCTRRAPSTTTSGR